MHFRSAVGSGLSGVLDFWVLGWMGLVFGFSLVCGFGSLVCRLCYG